LEQLVYATRLMNVASGEGKAVQLRDWFVQSDADSDPQAYVLRPDVALKLAAEIIAEPTDYLRTRRAALSSLAALRDGVMSGQIALSKPESNWLYRLSRQAEHLPEDESDFIEQMAAEVDRGKVRLDQYGIGV
jgi:methanol--5-hydroxybenzimidazolylcobamide Co-methyltransferase